MKNIFCNGVPKSGNHALMKAVELLGGPSSRNHRAFAEGLPEGTTHHVQVIRDPRNVAVSYIRFHKLEPTPQRFLETMADFFHVSLLERVQAHEGWLNTAHIIRFEQLIESDVPMRQLADYLGLVYADGMWEELPGLTATWNEVKSDYRQVWTPEVAAEWTAQGGDDLLRRWGY